MVVDLMSHEVSVPEEVARVDRLRVRSERREVGIEQRQRFFKGLEDLGLVEMKEDLVVINDLGVFKGKRGEGKSIRDVMEKVLSVNERKGVGTVELLFNYFEGVPVLTRQDYGQQLAVGSMLEARNLFLVPSGDPYDIKQLRQAADDSYLGLWQVGASIPGRLEMSYPTVEKGWESRVDFTEVTLAAAVYGFGKGFESGGRLWVKEDDSWRVLTGERLQEMTGIRVLRTGGDLKDSVHRALLTEDEGGQNSLPGLVERGLLLPSHFDSRDWVNHRLSRKGAVWLTNEEGEGRRYHFGSEYAGLRAMRLEGNQFVIYGQDDRGVVEVGEVVNVGMIREEEATLRYYPSGYRGWDVSRSAMSFVDMQDRKIGVPVLGLEGKRGEVERWRLRELLPELVKFRLAMIERLGDGSRDEMEKLPLREQVALWRLFVGLGADADEDIRVYWHAYVSARDQFEEWLSYFRGWEVGMERSEERAFELFLSRIERAYGQNWVDLLLLLGSGAAEKVEEEMLASQELVEGLLSMMRGAGEYQLGEVKYNWSAEREVEAINLIYRDGQGSELRLLFRPRQVRKMSSKGEIFEEAGMRATLLADGQRIAGLRVDLGAKRERPQEVRMSLDMDVFKSLGMEHHTEVPFEKSLSNPQLFAWVIERMAAGVVLVREEQAQQKWKWWMGESQVRG